MNPILESKLGDKVNDLIAARGHNTSARAWVESVGFTYLSANAKISIVKSVNFAHQILEHLMGRLCSRCLQTSTTSKLPTI